MPELTHDEKEQRILDGVITIPSKHLANHILKGDVLKSKVYSRLTELAREDKITEIENLLAELDDQEWANAEAQGKLRPDSPEPYIGYMGKYPEGRHAHDCQARLADFDERLWQSVQRDLSEDLLNHYKACFPQGAHIAECASMLGDLPWLKTKRLNTITGYEGYMASNPGRHDAEAKKAIADLNDDNDWFNAESANTSYAYQQYLEKHPTGKYSQKAQNALDSNAGRDRIIENIKKDKNYYDPDKLNKFVGDKRIAWTDIEGKDLFTHEERVAIEKFVDPKKLPEQTPPERLIEGVTQIYFWGTPHSGKTCAMGAVLSAAKKFGRLTEFPNEKNGSGQRYMHQLSNIFVSDDICVFPHGTSPLSIQQMLIGLRDKDKKVHKMNLIDLAGELFKSLFYKLNDPATYNNFAQNKQDALERTISYLGDKNSKYGNQDTGDDKIHFFIVAYGEEKNTWEDEDLFMSDFLNTTIAYLNERKVIQTNTVGVYVLVTKSDLMPCDVGERKEFAEKYVMEKMPDFYNNIVEICKHAGVKDFEIIPFSIGSVFAQNLGHFESENTKAIINKLILKTHPERGGFINWLKS